MSRLEVTILGCGSSGGVPRPGGPGGSGFWGACDPADPRNRRSRCSLLVSLHGEKGVTRALVDTSPDLREQLLRSRTSALDGVVITHDHADQLHGIDDLRLVVQNQRRKADIYTDAETAEGIVTRFSYCFRTPGGSEYPPIAVMHVVEPQKPFVIDGAGGPLPVLTFRQKHGSVHSLGVRFGPVAYSADANELDEAAFSALEGVELWIVDALRYTPHPSHAHVAKALQWIARVNPAHAILTNLHVDIDYETLRRDLPANIQPAYDGLTVTVSFRAE